MWKAETSELRSFNCMPILVLSVMSQDLREGISWTHGQVIANLMYLQMNFLYHGNKSMRGLSMEK